MTPAPRGRSEERKEAALAYCDRCRKKTTRDAGGDCTLCRLEEQRVERRARIERQRAADRRRLGLQPAAGGRALVGLCIDSGLHWMNVAARAGTPLPDATRRHLEAARKELER